MQRSSTVAQYFGRDAAGRAAYAASVSKIKQVFSLVACLGRGHTAGQLKLFAAYVTVSSSYQMAGDAVAVELPLKLKV